MHMKSAPHLLSEDRADFERILDEALRNAHDRPELAAVGQRLNAEQLRTMALNATALITSSASAEYEHFAALREEFRTPATTAPVGGSLLAPAIGEAAETGAGLAAVVTVLVPLLAGISAAIFLLVGYVLKALDPPPAFADTMLTAGWFFGAVTAAGILAAAIALLMTALRNSSTQLSAGERGSGPELPEEVAEAREVWREAVLERGILPYLRAALAAPAVEPAPAPPRPASHLPKMGYSRPDFSSPDEGGSAAARPTYSSPDFSSPDFGGPEHRPE